MQAYAATGVRGTQRRMPPTKNICAQVEPEMHEAMAVACVRLGTKLQRLLPYLYAKFLSWIEANPDVRWDAARGALTSDRLSSEARVLHALNPNNWEADAEDDEDDGENEDEGDTGAVPFLPDVMEASRAMHEPVGDVLQQAVRVLMRAHAARPDVSLADLVAALDATIAGWKGAAISGEYSDAQNDQRPTP